MEQEIIIGVILAVTVAAALGIHSWLHKLVTFKMDESAIIKFFESTDDSFTFLSKSAICSGTDLPEDRVALVCDKSKAIRRNARDKESWCLR